MNLRIVSKMIGIVAMLISATMTLSLPWAISGWGRHTTIEATDPFETDGFWGLLISIVISLTVGIAFFWIGRKSGGRLFLKEAMAIVGLSWIMATVLGALPFLLSGTYRGPALRLWIEDGRAQICGSNWLIWGQWFDQQKVSPEQARVVEVLLNAGWQGLDQESFEAKAGKNFLEVIRQLQTSNEWWDYVILEPDEEVDHPDIAANYRIRWKQMGVADALFESQSGFSTTGATVISNLEDGRLVPHCILFWRSMTHFLGGLGIIVLFVTILGQGSAGKALMRAEMPGPTKEGSTARMQHTAWIFAVLYCGLNAVLALIYWLLGMTIFDALCHAFGTMATGGFSTYNASVGHFYQSGFPTAIAIEYVTIIFMILAGSNFTLLYLAVILQPIKLFSDLEWRTYVSIISITSIVILIIGMQARSIGFENFEPAFRNSMFQVVSIMTTTGYGTNDFDLWPDFSRGILLVLMFVGGCAGSTGGGMKVIRHILFFKIIRLDMERSFHPRVVRPLRIGGKPTDEQLRHSIFLYTALILALFVISWVVVIGIEPTAIWGGSDQKLIDAASAVAATLNNIGPGFGTVGPTQNYGHLTGFTKLLFVWLMMLGRLEIFSILALAFPRFWRD
jgi:trk system potassium uptake protein TrkH